VLPVHPMATPTLRQFYAVQSSPVVWLCSCVCVRRSRTITTRCILYCDTWRRQSSTVLTAHSRRISAHNFWCRLVHIFILLFYVRLVVALAPRSVSLICNKMEFFIWDEPQFATESVGLEL